MQTEINEILKLKKERQDVGQQLSQSVKKLSKFKHFENGSYNSYIYHIKRIKNLDSFISDYGFYRENKTYVHKITGQRIRLNTFITDPSVLSLFKKYYKKNPKKPYQSVHKYGYENIPNYVLEEFIERKQELNEYLDLESERKNIKNVASDLDKKILKLEKNIKSEINSNFLTDFNDAKLLDNGFNIEQLLSFLNNIKQSLADYEIVFSTKNFFQTNDFFNKDEFKLIKKDNKETLSFEESIYLVFKNTQDLDIKFTLYTKYSKQILNCEFKNLIYLNQKGA
tara:strand:- start:3260 stop:4105 length:846 start_codon:yes stop_codon:yes gene_type:complete